MVAREPIYHAATEVDWAARTATHYRPASLADEGFIHCSTGAQLVDTLHRHYPGRRDLILLTIDPAALGSRLIFEDLYGRGAEYPHLYGPIELAAVVTAEPLAGDDGGRFDDWEPAGR